MAGPPALGTVVAEAAHAQHDQRGVDLVQPGQGEAEPVEHPGAEVLDQHFAVLDQSGEHPAAVVAGSGVPDRPGASGVEAEGRAGCGGLASAVRRAIVGTRTRFVPGDGRAVDPELAGEHFLEQGDHPGPVGDPVGQVMA